MQILRTVAVSSIFALFASYMLRINGDRVALILEYFKD